MTEVHFPFKRDDIVVLKENLIPPYTYFLIVLDCAASSNGRSTFTALCDKIGSYTREFRNGVGIYECDEFRVLCPEEVKKLCEQLITTHKLNFSGTMLPLDKVYSTPPYIFATTELKARSIAAENSGATADEVVIFGEKPDNCNLYNAPKEPCWYAYVPWNDGVTGIRSSRVIVISKANGDILYDGSARDEG